MPDYTVYLFDSQIAASRVLRVGVAADRIAHVWTNATAHEDITAHPASATTPLRALVQVLEELCWLAESAAILAISFPNTPWKPRVWWPARRWTAPWRPS